MQRVIQEQEYKIFFKRNIKMRSRNDMVEGEIKGAERIRMDKSVQLRTYVCSCILKLKNSKPSALSK